jgi:hypothetical protein
VTTDYPSLITGLIKGEYNLSLQDTRQKKDSVVMISSDDFKALEETARLLRRQKLGIIPMKTLHCQVKKEEVK